MKYLLRTDIKKVSTETNNYITTPFKKDRTDLSFMTREDLERYVFEEVFTDEEREKSLEDIDITTPYNDISYNLQAKYVKQLFVSITLERLQDLYSNDSSKTIVYATYKVSKERFNALKEKFNNITHVIDFNGSEETYLINSDLYFLETLEKNGTKYTITC